LKPLYIINIYNDLFYRVLMFDFQREEERRREKGREGERRGEKTY
jgi:hypothetical protein